MAISDDIVLRPRIRDMRLSLPRQHAEVERHATKAAEKSSKMVRALTRRAKLGTARFGARIAGSALNGMRAPEAVSVMRGATRMGARSMLMTPVGALVAGIAVAAVVATRLISGRSFENIGENVKDALVGPMSPKAAASRDAKEFLYANDSAMRIAATEDPIATAGLHRVYSDLAKQNEIRALGHGAIMRNPEMQVDGYLDMLAKRLAQDFKDSWNGNGGPMTVEKLAWKLGSALFGWGGMMVGGIVGGITARFR